MIITTCRSLLSVSVAMAMAGCAVVSKPVSPPQVASFAMHLSDALARQSEPLAGPLSVEHAVERALRFNASIRARELELALAEAKVRVQGMSMLPKFVGEIDYYNRDRPLLSRSQSSPLYSSSSDLRTVSRDMTLSWNILDFGLAFVRARQGLDKARQQELEIERVSARIVEETRSVYWRAAASSHLVAELARLVPQADRALALAKKASRDPTMDPATAINLQRDVLTMLRDLNQIHAGLAGSVAHLAQLVGAEPSANIRLNTTHTMVSISSPQLAGADAIQDALHKRPEVRQAMYDLRITEDEIDAAIMQVLPGVSLSKTLAGSSNSFLYHPSWVSWGTNIAANLIEIVRLPANIAAIDSQRALHRQNAIATASTIAMQVLVARARLDVHTKTSRDAHRMASVQRDLVDQAQAAFKAGRIGEQVLVRERLALLLAETRDILAFAELHAAAAAYDTAVGTRIGLQN